MRGRLAMGLWGGLGAALVWGLLTVGTLLYHDHVKVGQLYDLELRRAAATQQAGGPAAPPPQ